MEVLIPGDYVAISQLSKEIDGNSGGHLSLPPATPHCSEQQRELWPSPGSPAGPCLGHSVGLERAESIFVMLLLGVFQLPWKPGKELERLHTLPVQGP